MTCTWTYNLTDRDNVTADDLLFLSHASHIRATDLGFEPPELRIVLTSEQKASVYRELQESGGMPTPPHDATDVRWYGLTLV